jgi:hypothetical protein
LVPTVPPSSSSSTQEGQEEAQARRPAVPVRGGRLQQQTHVPFSGGRKHIPRFVRIVSMQDSNAATLRHRRPWRWWSSGRAARDRSDDDDAGKQYCTAGVTTTSLPRTSSSFFCSLIWSRGGGAAKRLRLVNSRHQHFFLLLRHRMPACVPLSRHRQSSNLRACT